MKKGCLQPSCFEGGWEIKAFKEIREFKVFKVFKVFRVISAFKVFKVFRAIVEQLIVLNRF